MWDRIGPNAADLFECLNLKKQVAPKGELGRLVPTAKDLKVAMGLWRSECGAVDHKGRIITTERAKQTSAQAVVNMFAEWFAVLGFTGCSSHSGRRTFITNAARKISSVGGSLRHVQSLAGHSSLTTTQRYIEVNGDAKQRVVSGIWYIYFVRY
jgi:integrase/recombinase XerD